MLGQYGWTLFVGLPFCFGFCAVLLHVAPNVRKTATGYEPMTVGTTTSMRMDRFTGGLLGEYGVRAIIGKGGLSEESSRAFQTYGGVYLAIVGGAASVETEQVEAIEAVYWEDLMPECLWQFRVRDFFGDQRVRDDTDDLASCRAGCIRQHAHQSDVPAAVDDCESAGD